MMKKIIYLFLFSCWFVFTGCAVHYHIDFLGESEIMEKTLISSKSKNKILMINVDGIIMDSASGAFSKESGMLSKINYRLKLAKQDSSIKGIIFRINSPGGDPTSCESIRNEILKYKKDTGNPVIAYFMNLSASGGYYIATGTDKIIAHPLNLCGSIGVISIFPHIHGLMEKIGVTFDVLKTGAYKDSGSPLRAMKDEEKKNFQAILNNFYERFIEVVYENRKGKLTKDEIKKYADGNVFTAKEALANKLIDKTGFLEEAIDDLKNMAKISDAKLVVYTFFPEKESNLYSSADMMSSKTDFMNKYLENLFSPGFYYLWLPEKFQ